MYIRPLLEPLFLECNKKRSSKFYSIRSWDPARLHNLFSTQLPPDTHHVTGLGRGWQHGASTPWRIIARSRCADLSALVLDVASAWTRPSEKPISWEKSFLTEVSWPGGYEQRSSEGHVYIEAFLSIDIHQLSIVVSQKPEFFNRYQHANPSIRGYPRQRTNKQPNKQRKQKNGISNSVWCCSLALLWREQDPTLAANCQEFCIM